MNTNRDQTLEAGGLRVRFLWRGDRYAHEVWHFDGAEWSCALVSVEGSAEDAWPISPPFQSLAVERREDGRPLALAVGMAGKSHWSASAEIDPRVPCVNLDVACRVRESQAGPLGSAYAANARRCPLEILPETRFAPARVERTAGVVRISVPAPPDTAARTIRWAYRIRPVG